MNESKPETKGHVLIVEDSPDLRALMRLALLNAGFQVRTAADGREALDQLSAVKIADELPRVILLDLMMPVMSGWEFLEKRDMKPELAAIPVIVLSAVKDGLPTGVKCLAKPVELPVLLDAVGAGYGR